jgi:hypothetical protein
MRTFLFTKILLCLTLLTTGFGCSVYQSEGRKFLEEQAFRFRNQSLSLGVIQQNGRCAEASISDLSFFRTAHWAKVAESFSPSYILFEKGTDQLPIVQVVAVDNQNRVFFCEMVYANEEDLEQNHGETLRRSLKTIADLAN